MEEDLQTVELQEIYRQADAQGRKNMVMAAAQLLNAQKNLEDKPVDAELDMNRDRARREPRFCGKD